MSTVSGENDSLFAAGIQNIVFTAFCCFFIDLTWVKILQLEIFLLMSYVISYIQ